MHTIPELEYDIKVNQQPLSLGDSAKVSFKEGANSIVIKFKSTNQSLNRFKVMITEESYEDWDLEEGREACNVQGSMAINQWYTANITVNAENFSHGDGIYRLLLCARGDIDYTWDAIEIFFTLSGVGSYEQFDDKDNNRFDTIGYDGTTIALTGYANNSMH